MGAEGAWSERGRGLNGKAHWLAMEGAWLNSAGPIGWLLRGRGQIGRCLLVGSEGAWLLWAGLPDSQGEAWLKWAMLIGCQRGGGGDHMTLNPFSPSLKLGLVLIDGKKMNGS